MTYIGAVLLMTTQRESNFLINLICCPSSPQYSFRHETRCFVSPDPGKRTILSALRSTSFVRMPCVGLWTLTTTDTAQGLSFVRKCLPLLQRFLIVLIMAALSLSSVMPSISSKRTIDELKCCGPSSLKGVSLDSTTTRVGLRGSRSGSFFNVEIK